MLRIVPSMSADGAKRYFDDTLARGDYYLEGEELAGNWGGEAAKHLGLVGEVSRDAFHLLCDNVNPATGKRLTARNRSGRRVGYDFNFHCPKTVSAVYALTKDERIMEAFRASVQETMRDLERDCECRVRDKGQHGSRTTGNMVWGEFIHMTTRPVDGIPDPHLHAHCFAFNATFDDYRSSGTEPAPLNGTPSLPIARGFASRSFDSEGRSKDAFLAISEPRACSPRAIERSSGDGTGGGIPGDARGTTSEQGERSLSGAKGESPERHRRKGMWKAADFGGIKRDARYFEAAFHARFAGRMAQMGYPVQRDGKGFWDIAGIPASVKDKYSRRTAEIEALAEELGIVDPKALDQLGAQSRQAKTKGMPLAKLRDTWNSWLTPEERQAIQDAKSDADGTARLPGVSVADAMDHAIAHRFERRSAVSRRELAETALRHGVGAVSVSQAWRRAEGMEQAGTLITGEVDGRKMVTTRRVLAEEQAMLAFARSGRGAAAPLGHPDYVFTDPLFHDGSKDTAEQQAAIREVLGSHDRVIAIRGAAGTGKTTLMREVVSGIQEGSVRSPLSDGPTRSALRDGGHQVFAFAPTAEASRGVLRGEGFEQADTVARLLMDRELQQQVRGQVLWIDEAGLLGAKALNAVFRVAEAQGCRVILTGDTRQHHSVERGDAMRVLEEYGGTDPIAITKIQRQRVHGGSDGRVREPEKVRQYRQAVSALSEGDPARGYAVLETMGAVVEFGADVAPQEHYRQIAGDYLEAVEGTNRKGKPNTVLAVSPTHAEGNAVTEHIREGLKQAGRIGKVDREASRLINLNWTEAERADATKYQPGQVIQFHQNVQGGIKRGQRFTVVESFDDVQAPPRLRGSTPLGRNTSVLLPNERKSDQVLIRGDDGTTRTLPLESASRFSVYGEGTLPLAKGDRIRITQNGFTADRKHRLNNGAMYTVAGFTRKGHIRLENGWEIDGAYGHLSHGYVTTSHASQGKSVDVVLVAQGTQSLAASSLEQFYVSVSRGKEQVRVYTDDREALGDAIRRSGKRVAATELAGSDGDLRSGAAQAARLSGARSLRSRNADGMVPELARSNAPEPSARRGAMRGSASREAEQRRTRRYRQVLERRRSNQQRRTHEPGMDRG